MLHTERAPKADLFSFGFFQHRVFIRLAPSLASWMCISYVFVEQLNSDSDFASRSTARTLQRPCATMLAPILRSCMQGIVIVVVIQKFRHTSTLHIKAEVTAATLQLVDVHWYKVWCGRPVGDGLLVQPTLYVLCVLSLELPEELLHFYHAAMFQQTIDLLLPFLVTEMCSDSIVDQIC